MTVRAELSSVSTLLEELVVRISAIADSMTPAELEALGAELAEVERSLTAAQRRLVRALSS
ncbi:MAG: hypothetical protein J2P57_12190 [Acidimicrobiaceae bacterium]|nr:hypothetical protein [Acidimicrobiaceae bacterium]